MELSTQRREEAERVEHKLSDLLDGLDPGWAPRLSEAMRYSLLGGGKRLRAMLCLWVHDATGTERTEALWRGACALEMIHAYSLIHDDLPAMDDDDLRRGKPSCHRRFDEATAILAGDTLQTEAFHLLAGTEPPALALILIERLAAASGLAGMAAGQQLDLEANGERPDADRMRRIHRLKTGRLIGASVAFGAACAGLDVEAIDRAQGAGEKLGLAFQVVDDLLDLRADARTLGKTAGKDREQEKLTAVTSLGADAAEREAERLLTEGQAELEALGLVDARVRALTELLVRRDR